VQANDSVSGVRKGISVGKSKEVIDIKLIRFRPLLVTYSINLKDSISHIKIIKKNVIYKKLDAICLKI
tara:strand:+ start:126 stop:329 length:204 start_codon:yes stop_codon:yes gene_type:complete